MSDSIWARPPVPVEKKLLVLLEYTAPKTRTVLADVFVIEKQYWDEFTVDAPDRCPMTFYLTDHALEEEEPEVGMTVTEAVSHCRVIDDPARVQAALTLFGGEMHHAGNVDFSLELVQSYKA